MRLRHPFVFLGRIHTRVPIQSPCCPCPSLRLLTSVVWLWVWLNGLSARAADGSGGTNGVRLNPLAGAGTGSVGFVLRDPARTGIHFTNRLALNRGLTNQIYLNGSGVAAGDVDGDGRCDLYFCGLDSPNALYLNRGNWRFEEVAGNAGVSCPDQASTGAVLADLDGDRDLDLIVNAIDRGPRVFLNDSKGRFTEITTQAGLGSAAGGMSLALADVDGDGDLDLYVVNYRRSTMRDEPEKRFRVSVTNGVYQLVAVDNQPAIGPELANRFTVDPVAGVLENGEADALYLNEGGGRFRRVDWSDGFRTETGAPAKAPFDWGLSAMFRDLNQDGAPDLYVCNDFQSPDRIWLNDGRGRFRALPRSALRQTSLFSMGVDVADVDRDGWDDVFVVDMLSREHARRQVQVMDLAPVNASDPGSADRPQISRNTLLRNRGDGTYAELAFFAGVEASEWSWCPTFLDVDLDGFEDLLITTGHGRDAQNADVAAELDEVRRRQRLSFAEQLRMRSRFEPLEVPNVAFRNRGDFTFEDHGPAWGFDSRRVSQGLALADLDGDGDLDVVINCLNDSPLVYENTVTLPRIAVRLNGLASNTHGIGARICVRFPNLPQQCQELVAGGRYLSSDDAVRSFAAGGSGQPGRVEVHWRSGRVSFAPVVLPGQGVELDESAATEPTASASPAATESWFADRTTQLKHSHVDEPVDDFSRQRLLPHKLSEAGPGVAWFDFNGDGWDDLLMGSGVGGAPAVFRNDTHGGFVAQRATNLLRPVERDLTTVLGWRPEPARSVLLFGFLNSEPGDNHRPAIRQVDLTSGAVDESLPMSPAGAGPLALGDFDGDGHIDLFAGGQCLAGRFPEAGDSRMFRFVDGRWEVNQEASELLKGAGRIQSALFSDLDDDGKAELILAGEWGPVRVLRWRPGGAEFWDPPVSGRPVGSTEAVPLSRLTGGWNSITTGDFNGDGLPDLVAGNWGRNTRNQRFSGHALELLFADVDQDGVNELLEARFDPGERRVVPAHDWRQLAALFPSIREHYSGFAAFSRVSISDLQGQISPPLKRVTEELLESSLFLNRGDHLEWVALPFEVQVAPVFGIASGDFDGDGREDLFASQNFLGVPAGEGRYDAGRGVLLLGDGRGGWTPVPARESGLLVDGEGRGTAVADFDHDGRLDLVVGQYRGPTRLFQNRHARPGLRVRLRGPATNPSALGARVRLVYADGTLGPAREVRAGGGYWSQDSAELVMGKAQEPVALEVRWPGGTRKRVPLSAGAQEVMVQP